MAEDFKLIGPYSAYGIAKKYGFKGTEEEWLTSLNGKDGISSTITIGKVTKLPSSYNPSVENRGNEHNAIFDFGIPAPDYSVIDYLVNSLFVAPRTGKVYSVNIPKFASNQTTVCDALDDNVGLVCEPSTEEVAGQDDYEDIPLFKWYHCNYKRDEYGHAYPTEIEGMTSGYTTSGNVDVGTIQMVPYVKFVENDDHYVLSITDSPKEGFSIWPVAKSNNVEYPYVIHSTYFSVEGDDSNPRSLPGKKIIRNNSYQNMGSKYGAKGSGYHGAGMERNTWRILFELVKYKTKSSQTVFSGCTNWNFQYSAAVKSSEPQSYFPLTNSQAANLEVGGVVSVGYANQSESLDRGQSSVHAYADSVKILSIEDLDGENKAVYLDCDPFTTEDYIYPDGPTVPITLTSMHNYTGETDGIIGKHDGQKNANSKWSYRIQGCEYACGGYTVFSDSVIVVGASNAKNLYMCGANDERKTDVTQIKESFKNVGEMAIDGSNDFWIGDVVIDPETGASYPSVVGSGSSTGVGDRVYAGGEISENSTREWLNGGLLWLGSVAGSSYLNCGGGLTDASWDFLAAD